MKVYIGSAPENIVPQLALEADRVLEDRWNGWLRPLATAREFGAFLDRCRLSDSNGVWGCVESADGRALYYRNSDAPAGEQDDEFPAAGTGVDGDVLYDLTGWVWIAE